jgi:hypothetical protein
MMASACAADLDDVEGMAWQGQVCSMAGLDSSPKAVEASLAAILESGLQIPLALRPFLGGKRSCKIGGHNLGRQVHDVLFGLLISANRADPRMHKRYGLYRHIEVTIFTSGVRDINLCDTAGAPVCGCSSSMLLSCTCIALVMHVACHVCRSSSGMINAGAPSAHSFRTSATRNF